MLFIVCLFATVAYGQTVSYKSFKHYNEKVAAFDKMRKIDSTDIVMLGNSLTEFAGDWNKLAGGFHIRNRGIAGDDAEGIYNRLNQVLSGKPKAVFLMAGINDLSRNLNANQVFELVKKVIDKIRRDAPTTKLYVQSILPINESFGIWKKLEGKTDVIPVVNRKLRIYCERNKITYIDLFPKFVRHGTNEMRRELSKDGLHLSPIGYKIWAFVLRKYIADCGGMRKR